MTIPIGQLGQQAVGAQVAHKAPPRAPEGDGHALRFASPAELRAATPPDVPWVWEGYVARGAVTLLAGKPKVGKSTLASSLIGAVVSHAGSFLERAVTGGPVVYVSEEGAGTLLGKLPNHDGLRVLTRDAAWPKPSWAQLVAAGVAEALRVGAVMLMVDTFAFWADLPPEAEKDAGAVQQAVGVLGEATRAGLAVPLFAHQRKAGGEGGDAVRGSSALAGAVDAVVEYERPQGDASGRQRQLVAVSRWPATPALLLVDHDVATSSWRVVGQGGARGEALGLSHREALLRAVPSEEPGATEDELVDVIGVDKRKLSGPLRDLLKEGLIERDGAGKKGNSYRYWRTPENAAPKSCPDAGAETGPERCCPAARPPRGGQHSISLQQKLPAAPPGGSFATDPDAEPTDRRTEQGDLDRCTQHPALCRCDRPIPVADLEADELRCALCGLTGDMG